MEWKAKEKERKAEEEEKGKAAKPKPKATAAPAPNGPQKPPSAAAPPPSATVAAEANPAPEAIAFPPLPAVPREVGRWHERDFLVARLRQQLELFGAIAYIGTHRSEDAISAQILGRLLQPDQFAELAEFVTSTPAESNEEYSNRVITAAIDALGRNKTPAARRALGQLIMGTLATEDNTLAASQALAALAAHPSPAHEEMLLRVAMEAEQLVAPKGAGLSTDKLRQQSLALITQNATATLRTRIAEALIKNRPSPEVRAAFEKLLSAPVQENFDAHLALYLAPREVVSFRESIERQFAIYSGNALLSVLTPREGPANYAWNKRIAETMWTKKFGLMVEARLNRLDHWSEEPELLSLACSLPTDTMRAAILRRLEKQWALGPNPFASQQASEIVIEPGVLVLLRSIYQERADAEPVQKTPTVSLRYGRRPNLEGLRLQEYQKVQESWAEVAGDLAATWCERCRYAALDRDAKQRAKGLSTNWTALVKDFPVQPHSTDSLAAAYSVEWKGISGEQESDDLSNALRLHYIRLEERIRPKRLVAGYRRSFPTLHPRETTDGGCLEGIVDGSIPGFVRSIDIRISRAAYGTHQLPDEEQELIIEILSVEVRNPEEGYSTAAR